MQPYKISVALSGGGALGFAHIAAIQAFDDLGLSPYALSGTSMGSIIGAAWAKGLDSKEILDFCEEQLSNKASLMAKLLKLKGKQSKNLFQGGNIIQFDALAVLDMFLPEPFPKHFDELQIPLCIVATDFYEWKEVHFRKGNLSSAVASSIAIPAIFEVVSVAGRHLIDGGCTNPMPFDCLPEDSDLTLAIDVLGGPKMRQASPSAKESLLGGMHILMQSIINEKLKHRTPDILAYPELNDYGALEFHKFKSIIADAQSMREKVKYLIDHKLQSL